MPGWVQQGYDEYAKRLPRECELVLKEIAPGKRSKNSDVARIVKDEGERMIAAIPQGTLYCDLGYSRQTVDYAGIGTGDAALAGKRSTYCFVGGRS